MQEVVACKEHDFVTSKSFTGLTGSRHDFLIRFDRLSCKHLFRRALISGGIKNPILHVCKIEVIDISSRLCSAGFSLRHVKLGLLQVLQEASPAISWFSLDCLIIDYLQRELPWFVYFKSCCRWLKSCTTWDLWNPRKYLSTGAGFRPSTVALAKTCTFNLLPTNRLISQVTLPHRGWARRRCTELCKTPKGSIGTTEVRPTRCSAWMGTTWVCTDVNTEIQSSIWYQGIFFMLLLLQSWQSIHIA